MNDVLDKNGVSELTSLVKTYIDEQDNTIKETKQDVLTAGQNITIENNVISADIEDIEPFTTQEMEDICDDIFYPALPAPTNVTASGTDISFDDVQGATSYVVYANGNEIGEVPALQEEYFLTFSSPNSFTLNVGDNTKHWDGALEYSTDKNTWSEWDGTTYLTSGSNNELYLRGIGNTIITGVDAVRWVLNGNDISCDGNIENLLDYQTVLNGQHPVMGDYCYQSMFNGCTSLITAPELPATTLIDSCYNYMFAGCTSLITAPQLPAMTLATWCYGYMFNGCTSLTQAPELLAATLAVGCYQNMFNDCTSLTTAPALPATTLADSCYYSMFNGCKSLTTAPELPATTLARACYQNMFPGCTSLTTAPELPATTLADYCYQSMFYGCTSLYVSDTQTPDAQYEWRIPTNSVITGTTYSQASMFTNCPGTRSSDDLAGEVGQQYIYYTQNPPIGNN